MNPPLISGPFFCCGDQGLDRGVKIAPDGKPDLLMLTPVEKFAKQAKPAVRRDPFACRF